MERILRDIIIKIFEVLIIIAIIAGIVYAVKKYFDNKFSGSFDSSKAFKVETVVELDGEVIRDSLSDIGELATEEYYFTEVETRTDSKEFKGVSIPFTKNSFTIRYEGSIKAGMDFDDIEVEVDKDKKTVTIKIPNARILSTDIDLDSYELLDETNSIFNKITVTDVNDALKDLEATAQSKAVEKGVLKRANENAEKVIRTFLKTTYGLTDYTVLIEKAE